MKEKTERQDSVCPSGVDRTLIRKYLKMTPTERILAHHSAARLALELRKHAPRSAKADKIGGNDALAEI
jgi:hypothetical protein